MFDDGQCATAVFVSASSLISAEFRQTQCAHETFGADPVGGDHIIGRAFAEFLEAEFIFVLRLGDMGVTENVMRLGESARVLQQVERDRERGAGHQVDPRHRVRLRVVEFPDDTFRVLHDGRFILHNVIGGQATLAASERHRAASRVEAHAEFRRAFDDRLGFHVGFARVEVEHVVGRRATREQHFRHRDL